MRPSSSVRAEGLPSVIMTIWRMSFFLAIQDALRHAQAFARVRVVRADLHAGQFAERNFLGAVVEEHAVQGIAGILRADQVRERERHALRRREAILAVENHAVAAIEHQHRGAGALILALVDHQVGVVHVRCGTLRAFAAHGGKSVALMSRFSVSPNS